MCAIGISERCGRSVIRYALKISSISIIHVLEGFVKRVVKGYTNSKGADFSAPLSVYINMAILIILEKQYMTDYGLEHLIAIFILYFFGMIIFRI